MRRMADRDGTTEALFLWGTVLLLAWLAWAPAWSAPTDCGQGTMIDVCVRAIDTAPPAMLDAVRQVVADNACEGATDAGGMTRSMTTESGLAAIQQRLSLERRNFLWLADAAARGCDVEVVVLSPSSPVAASMSVATSRPERRPTPPGSRLPELLVNYESRDEALPDLLLMIDRFDYLDADDRMTALNAMQAMYFDWRLPQARQFIEQVARGDRRYDVEPSVGALALRLLTSMEGD